MYQVRTSGFEYYIEYWFERNISYNLRKKKKFPTHLRPLIQVENTVTLNQFSNLLVRSLFDVRLNTSELRVSEQKLAYDTIRALS